MGAAVNRHESVKAREESRLSKKSRRCRSPFHLGLGVLALLSIVVMTL